MGERTRRTARSAPAAAPRADVQAADPALRRRALVIAVIAVLAGTGTIAALPGWVEGYFGSLADAPPAARAHAVRTLALGAAAALGVPLGVLGLYFLRASRRVLAAGRHPPPGMRVVVDTPILVGPAALSHGRRLRRSGWVCVLAGPLLAAWSYARLGALATLLGAG